MEIRLIGTGSMWSVCNCASYQIGRNIMIDFPSGIFKEMLREGLEPRTVDSVIITHTHGDHILDLPVWALSKVKFGLPEHKSGIYASEAFVSSLRSLIHESFPESLNDEVIDEYFEFITDDEFSIDSFSFRRIPVSHGDREAFGYTVSDGRHTVSFSGDTAICPNLRMMAEKSDILICDAAKITESKWHQGLQSVIDLASEFRNCSVITTHMNDETRTELMACHLPDNLSVGTDGAVIKLN